MQLPRDDPGLPACLALCKCTRAFAGCLQHIATAAMPCQPTASCCCSVLPTPRGHRADTFHTTSTGALLLAQTPCLKHACQPRLTQPTNSNHTPSPRGLHQKVHRQAAAMWLASLLEVDRVQLLLLCLEAQALACTGHNITRRSHAANRPLRVTAALLLWHLCHLIDCITHLASEYSI